MTIQSLPELVAEGFWKLGGNGRDAPAVILRLARQLAGLPQSVDLSRSRLLRDTAKVGCSRLRAPQNS